MPKVELPKDLSQEVKRERENAAKANREEDGRTEPLNSTAAWAEHEKSYGAKLPPEVVEFEEAEPAKPSSHGTSEPLPVHKCPPPLPCPPSFLYLFSPPACLQRHAIWIMHVLYCL